MPFSLHIDASTKHVQTQRWHEGQFGTNHLGPFAFTNLILPRILKSSSPRIVNVSSGATRLTPIRFDDPFFKSGEANNIWHAYGQSITANILCARELAKRYGNNGLVAFSLHPGVIITNLSRSVRKEDFQLPVYDAWGELFYIGNIQHKFLGQGAATHLVAAFDLRIKANSGSFLVDCQVANDHEHLKAHAKSDEDADKLWTLVRNWLDKNFLLIFV
ncbi:hypothetical protein BGW37DRAFT_469583 [Umbelopsis sp. PMI_123]|nr:hypothetical protein BGW37DRAFT_469583 [Umbelopsis sp. PMI_123]